MERIGRKAAAFLAAAGIAVLLAQPVWATAPAVGGGTFAATAFVGAPSIRLADGNTFVTETITGVIAGTIVGTIRDVGTIILHPDGTLNVSGVETCVCTVAGRSGTFVDRFEASGVGLSATGPFTVISSTGALSNLHLTGMFTLVLNPATGLAAGPYSIDYHFDP
ncbi:MAG TPA: DUF3224 domain-containing protein [Candidatus Acidoferrum sp.]|nr:DUF3224 domain-containing protein [Candidatus Acidoferrum sp.]